MKKMKRILSMALAIVLTLTMFSTISMPTVEAKTKTIKVTMYVGERFSFDNLYIYPQGNSFSMKTSNKKVVKVNKKEGILVAKKAGKATITYTYEWYDENAKRKDITKKVKITVKNHPTASGCDYTLSAFNMDGLAADSTFDIHYDNVKLKYPKEFTAYRKVTLETYDISVTFDGKPMRRRSIGWYDTYKVTDVESDYTDDSGVWHNGSTTLVKIDTSIMPCNGTTVNGEVADVDVVDYNFGNISVGESVTKNYVVDYNIGTLDAYGDYQFSNSKADYVDCKVGDIITVKADKMITQEEANAFIYANYNCGRLKVTVVPIEVQYETRKSKRSPIEFIHFFTHKLKLYD